VKSNHSQDSIKYWYYQNKIYNGVLSILPSHYSNQWQDIEDKIIKKDGGSLRGQDNQINCNVWCKQSCTRQRNLNFYWFCEWENCCLY